MRWDEIDFVNALWSIPAQKNADGSGGAATKTE